MKFTGNLKSEADAHILDAPCRFRDQQTATTTTIRSSVHMTRSCFHIQHSITGTRLVCVVGIAHGYEES